MRHLSRAGLILGVILIIVFVLPQVLPIPDSLQEFGFISKDNDRSTRVWAGKALQYADPSDCGTCHQEKHNLWARNSHRMVSCENCHGPGVAHVQNGAAIIVDKSRDNCGLCHGQVRSRPDEFPQIDLGEHGGSAPCITCHNPHQPAISVGKTTVVAEKDTVFAEENTAAAEEDAVTEEEATVAAVTSIQIIPHDLEGRDDCMLCHDIGGFKPFPAEHNGRGVDACQSCHRSRSTEQ